MSDEKELERELSELLTEQPSPSAEELQKAQLRSIPPKHEIRIQTQLDPIVEETLKFRKIAAEIDDRYDKYLDKVKPKKKDIK